MMQSFSHNNGPVDVHQSASEIKNLCSYYNVKINKNVTTHTSQLIIAVNK